ncbi:MAG: Ig-like domain-containing protein [Patescibacteria group bacterium]
MNTKQKVFLGAALAVGLSLASYIAVRAEDAKPTFEVAPSAGPAVVGHLNLSATQVAKNGTVTFTARVTDVSGVESVFVELAKPGGAVVARVMMYDYGRNADGAAGDETFGGSWNAGGTAGGVYALTLKMSDRLGNPASQSGGDLTVGDPTVGTIPTNTNISTINSFTNANTNTAPTDTTAPVISITSPAADGAAISAASYSVTANAADAESAVAKVEFYLDTEAAPRDTQFFDQPAGSHNYTWVFNLSGVANGSYTLRAVAHNGAGLTAAATRLVTVNITPAGPPFNVNITAPATGSTFASTDTVQFSVHAEDDLAVTKLELYSMAGGGAFSTAVANGKSINATMAVAASIIPLIAGFTATPICKIGEVLVCSLPLTTTTPKSVYAIAYDAASSSNSPLITVNVTTTKTTCVCQ